MSAATSLPTVPPRPSGRSAMNGYGANYSNGHAESGAGQGRPSPRVMPHINDLRASASETLVGKAPQYAGIHQLLEVAQMSAKSADTFVAYRRPDLAYVEHLIASEIIVNRIPKHKDYVDLQTQRGTLHHLNKKLLAHIHTQHEQFDKIKHIIINDNKRTGVQPRQDSSSGPQTASDTADRQQWNRNSHPTSPPYPMPDAASFVPKQNGAPLRDSLEAPRPSSSGRSTPSDFARSPKPRPPVQPKPQTLHGRALSRSTAAANEDNPAGDALSDRFARLRTAANPSDGNPPLVKNGESHDHSVQMPSEKDYQRLSAPVPSRPQGPRDMPGTWSAPPHPPKLPLDTKGAIAAIAGMPKAPSPTYSPARNMSTPDSINPPRSTARSMVGTGGRNNSFQAPSVSDRSSYFPPSSSPAPPTNRRASVQLPSELQIEAGKLFDYQRLYQLLIIDVRTREEYDEGHMFATNIICVEPTALRPDMSAEQVQEALTLSPDSEESLFAGRHTYDLVIYYDQDSSDVSFLHRPAENQREATLKNLYTALQDYNPEKPLRRPPILLMGGLDAWTDLVGPHALTMSQTAGRPFGPRSRKENTSIKRVPVGSRQSSMAKRRDYNPLDPEEERKWLEQARNERPALDTDIQEEGDEELDEDGTVVYRTTEDFLRRFPSADAVGQQSMMYPPRSQDPELHIPEAPSRPPPSAPTPPAIPQAPSRPAPSLGRTFSSGVHERNITPHNSGKSSQLPVYFPQSQHPRYRLPRTGLINFGVTCYMNSTIQCLNATMPLTNIFLSQYYQRYIQRENWKGSKGLMAENYATLLQNLWQGDVRACRPTSLRRLCGRFNSEWAIDRQQDAKEFLEFMLDILHEDLNTRWSTPPLQALTESQEANRERLPKPYAAQVEWERYIHRDNSVVSSLFAGQHASRLRCTTCGFTSTTYEAFYSISVEIPRDRPASLYDCLRSYCQEERLSGDEVWKCPHCKVEREATKKITITRAPQYLVIHLKRFSASHGERARKVRTPIEFPLNGLDMSPFTLPPLSPADEAHIERMDNNNGPSQQLKKLKSEPAMNGPFLYNAYAVMRHLGQTLTSGHYIALCKDASRNCWRQYNDERLTDFDPEELRGSDRLQNEQAYILFFQREGVMGTGKL